MKVFTTIAWTAVVLVLLAAYLVALTKLRMLEFQADARGSASGATMEFNQIMPRGPGLPAHAQARWPVRGVHPNMVSPHDPALIARGETRAVGVNSLVSNCLCEARPDLLLRRMPCRYHADSCGALGPA
jgi:hypothetical protein